MSGIGRPIRVLHLRDSPWVDGPGRTILETGSHVDPSRLDFHIGALVPDLQSPHPMVDDASKRGLQVHPILDRDGLGVIVARIVALIDRHRIDVLHTSEFRSNVLGLMVRRKRRIRLVTTVHGWIANDLRGRVFRVADKAVLRWFDRVIFVSHAVRSLVPRWWVPPARGRVLHNALVLGSYGAQYVNATRRRCGEDGQVNLLKVGRLSAEKGHSLLLQAFAAVAKDRPNLRLLLAGTGPQEQDLRAEVGRLGLTSQVEFLGFIQDMPSLYAKTDLVVQSSFTEGLPNVILEATYLRVPILATSVGGTAEVMEKGIGGELIEPGSAAVLEQGLRRYLADPAAFAAMAERGRDHVAGRFSFEARTAALSGIYEELL